MAGNKRKAEIDVKQVADYSEKVRKLSPSPLPKLSNDECKNYTLKSPFPQEFSIPSNIIYYIARNPLYPKGHLKLSSSCKSLARISRILPVPLLENDIEDDSDNDDGNKWFTGTEDETAITLKDQFFKLWIYNELNIYANSLPYLASTLLQKIYKFSLRHLMLHNQNLTFDELQILVSGGLLEHVRFVKNVIKNADGSVTEFEKIFELLCCKKLTMQSLHPEEHGIGKNTTKKIFQILSSKQMPVEQDILLEFIPDNFDFLSFSKFIKTNMTTGRQHTIRLKFGGPISDPYKNQLQEFVNEIIQIRGIYAHTIPVITFPGHDFGAYFDLCTMRNRPVEGILRKS